MYVRSRVQPLIRWHLLRLGVSLGLLNLPQSASVRDPDSILRDVGIMMS